MASRVISQALVVVAASVACGTSSTPRQAAAEDPGTLVIPPIGTATSAPPSAEPASEPADTRSTVAFAARDPRAIKHRPRSRALLTTEVQGLERLLDTTSASAPDRAQLRRRLAETYSELAWSASGPDAARARDEAIKHYVAIEADHPQYPAIDEVRYYLGLAHELNGNRIAARKAYFEVIAKTPSSKLIPLCYFAFGELFFMESATDPSKNELALQAFGEVLKYPPPDNAIYAEALLRQGQTYLRTKDDLKAKHAFARLRRDFPDSSATAEIPAGP